MRLLHTSDWHLGRSFGPISLDQDQRDLVEWFVARAVEVRADVVVLAGDVYDRAIPPTSAVKLLRDALVDLAGRGIRVVVIAGNHDSAERVAAYDGLVDRAGLHVRGGYERAGEVVHLDLPDGPLAIVPLPYLDPVVAPAAWDEGPGAAVDAPAERGPRRRSHEDVLRRALTTARARVAAPRSVVVAHAFVTSGEAAPLEAESERQLTVGGSGAVDASVFDGYSYVALGHLHNPQAVGGRTAVRYSGTPLRYSFSETAAKEVVLVELGPRGELETHAIPVPVGRGVATVRGRIDELLSGPPDPIVAAGFVRAVLTDPGTVIDAKVRLQERYPLVVEVELAPDRPEAGEAATVRPADRRRLSPFEAAERYWTELHGAAPGEDEARVLAAALEQAARA